ncbi:MAG: hypothetical protein WC243_03590 [Patescibacteria group bacterium]
MTLVHPRCGYVVEWETYDPDAAWYRYGVMGELPGTKIVFGNTARSEITWIQAWRVDGWDAGERPYWSPFQSSLAQSRANQLGIPVQQIPIGMSPEGTLAGVDFCPVDAEQAVAMFGEGDWTLVSARNCLWEVTNPEVRSIYVPRGSNGLVDGASLAGPVIVTGSHAQIWRGPGPYVSLLPLVLR